MGTKKKVSREVMEMQPSGKFVNPTKLEVEDIKLRDIVRHLGQTLRFGGATQRSVLMHSMEVEYILMLQSASVETRLCGLMHDAAEAYIGDIPRPLKDQIPAFAEIELSALETIWDVLGLPAYTDEVDAAVKFADELSCLIEAQRYMPSNGRQYTFRSKKHDRALEDLDVDSWYCELDERAAELRFVTVYDYLKADQAEYEPYPSWNEFTFENRDAILTDQPTTPSDRGRRDNNGKLRLELVSEYAIEAIAEVATWATHEKENPYPARNWEKGLPYMEVVASFKRHLGAFVKGENYDGESGLPHIYHALWNAHALAHFVALDRVYARFDDTPVYAPSHDVVEQD